MKISIIVAVDENWVIGKRGGLPWRLPADLKHFKTLTVGHTVIMGRRTYDSIGRPLPDRINIVLSASKNLSIPGCIMAKSIKEAIDFSPEDREVFIIGGAEIYNQFLPFVQRVYLTRIHYKFDGDIFFPKLDLSEWREIQREDFKSDDKNLYDYSFVILEKTR